MTTEDIYNFNIDNEEDINIVKNLLILFQSSIQMETTAKESREGWDAKGQKWEK